MAKLLLWILLLIAVYAVWKVWFKIKINRTFQQSCQDIANIVQDPITHKAPRPVEEVVEEVQADLEVETETKEVLQQEVLVDLDQEKKVVLKAMLQGENFHLKEHLDDLIVEKINLQVVLLKRQKQEDLEEVNFFIF